MSLPITLRRNNTRKTKLAERTSRPAEERQIDIFCQPRPVPSMHSGQLDKRVKNSTWVDAIETAEHRALRAFYSSCADALLLPLAHRPYGWSEARKDVRNALGPGEWLSDAEFADATFVRFSEQAAECHPINVAYSVARELSLAERIHALRIAEQPHPIRLRACTNQGIAEMRLSLEQLACQGARISEDWRATNVAPAFTDALCEHAITDLYALRERCTRYSPADAEKDAHAWLEANPGGLAPEWTETGRRARQLLREYPHLQSTLRTDEEEIHYRANEALRSKSDACRLTSILSSAVEGLTDLEKSVAASLFEFAHAADLPSAPPPLSAEGRQTLCEQARQAIRRITHATLR